MNIYEEEMVEKKFDELTDKIGFLVLDLLLISLKKIGRENQVYSDFVDVKRPEPEQDYPF
jgi:hypothetical protein